MTQTLPAMEALRAWATRENQLGETNRNRARRTATRVGMYAIGWLAGMTLWAQNAGTLVMAVRHLIADAQSAAAAEQDAVFIGAGTLVLFVVLTRWCVRSTVRVLRSSSAPAETGHVTTLEGIASMRVPAAVPFRLELARHEAGHAVAVVSGLRSQFKARNGLTQPSDAANFAIGRMSGRPGGKRVGPPGPPPDAPL